MPTNAASRPHTHTHTHTHIQALVIDHDRHVTHTKPPTLHHSLQSQLITPPSYLPLLSQYFVLQYAHLMAEPKRRCFALLTKPHSPCGFVASPCAHAVARSAVPNPVHQYANVMAREPRIDPVTMALINAGTTSLSLHCALLDRPSLMLKRATTMESCLLRVRSAPQ